MLDISKSDILEDIGEICDQVVVVETLFYVVKYTVYTRLKNSIFYFFNNGDITTYLWYFVIPAAL